jgi:hypothetical protein
MVLVEACRRYNHNLDDGFLVVSGGAWSCGRSTLMELLSFAWPNVVMQNNIQTTRTTKVVVMNVVVLVVVRVVVGLVLLRRVLSGVAVVVVVAAAAAALSDIALKR